VEDQWKWIRNTQQALSELRKQLEVGGRNKVEIQKQFDAYRMCSSEIVSALSVINDRLSEAGDDKSRNRHENCLIEAIKN
jgi:hypothetical protein